MIPVDVREIRKNLGLSQERFAERFCFPVKTIRSWEQRRKSPSGPAQLLLKVIAYAPDTVAEALTSIRAIR